MVTHSSLRAPKADLEQFINRTVIKDIMLNLKLEKKDTLTAQQS